MGTTYLVLLALAVLIPGLFTFVYRGHRKDERRDMRRASVRIDARRTTDSRA